MKLIVGLGNPGEKYLNNRHNVGFQFVDYLFNEFTGSRVNGLNEDKYANSQFAKFVIDNEEIILAKPQTFMNNSGIAVKKLILKFGFRISDLIVIHDDLDIPFGKFHIQVGIGPQLHNGLESIEKHLKSKDFTRIRIGIDNRRKFGSIEGEAYVLHDFLPDEKKILEELIFPRIISQLKSTHQFL